MIFDERQYENCIVTVQFSTEGVTVYVSDKRGSYDWSNMVAEHLGTNHIHNKSLDELFETVSGLHSCIVNALPPEALVKQS